MGPSQAAAFENMTLQAQILFLIDNLLFSKGPGKGIGIVQYIRVIPTVNADDKFCPLIRVLRLQKRAQNAL